MRTGLRASWGVGSLAAASLLSLLLPLCSQGSRAGEVRLVLRAGPVRLERRGGFDYVRMGGFALGGRRHLRPCRTVRVLLPPDVRPGSLRLVEEARRERPLPGTLRLPPAPRPAPLGPSRAGRPGDEAPPRRDAVVRLVGLARMGPFRYARIAFCPLRYDPDRRAAWVVEELSLRVEFERTGVAPGRPPRHRVPRWMLRRARRMFSNWKQAAGWYAPAAAGEASPAPEGSPPAPSPPARPSAAAGGDERDYVIVTTEAIRQGSEVLPSFIAWKEARGHRVRVVTEADYGQEGDRADLIRAWLRANHEALGIRYVLLIGDPTPGGTGPWAVPMKGCYPHSEEGLVPTDWYYADLSGSWDADGDGRLGEYPDDRDEVDFSPEVIVGRIPVYGGDLMALDAVLQKLMDCDPPAGAWRRRALLPEAIANYENEDGNPPTDGAELGEQLREWLEPHGISCFRLYEKEGLAPSLHEPDAPLTRQGLVDEWQGGYGLVVWFGHGTATAACRKVWSEDDGDWVPEEGEMSWPVFFWSSDASSLDDSRPSFVFECSCLNGKPEDTGNLQWSLLRHGAAAAVAATRTAWYAVGWRWPLGDYADIASLAYFWAQGVARGVPAGEALALVKEEQGEGWGEESWMNKMELNLLGDPALVLLRPADLDADGGVDGSDLAAFASYYGAGDLRADLDGDGEVTTDDLLVFTQSFGK